MVWFGPSVVAAIVALEPGPETPAVCSSYHVDMKTAESILDDFVEYPDLKPNGRGGVQSASVTATARRV